MKTYILYGENIHEYAGTLTLTDLLFWWRLWIQEGYDPADVSVVTV